MLVFNLETAELFWVLMRLTLSWRDFPCSSMFNSFIFFENSQTYVGDILIALNPFKPLEIYHKSVRMNIRRKLWSTFEFAVY